MNIPDGITPVTGYRVWHVGNDGSLTSITRSSTWSTLGTTVATCVESSPTDEHWETPIQTHLSPDLDCRCGMYAFKTIGSALESLSDACVSGPEVVVGSVAMWGRVVEGNFGYRAQYARVAELFTMGPHPTDGPLGALWGRSLSEVAGNQFPFIGGPYGGDMTNVRVRSYEHAGRFEADGESGCSLCWSFYPWSPCGHSVDGHYDFRNGVYLWQADTSPVAGEQPAPSLLGVFSGRQGGIRMRWLSPAATERLAG